jgi:hypothetical protein
MTDISDHQEIDALVAKFFGVFDNRAGHAPTLGSLSNLFSNGAVIIRDTGSMESQIYTVPEFAEPRILLLTNGELVEFYEEETNSCTEIAGAVASRSSEYRKHGRFHSRPYSGSGRKFFQFGRFSSGWRITAIAWSDFSPK